MMKVNAEKQYKLKKNARGSKKCSSSETGCLTMPVQWNKENVLGREKTARFGSSGRHF